MLFRLILLKGGSHLKFFCGIVNDKKQALVISSVKDSWTLESLHTCIFSRAITWKGSHITTVSLFYLLVGMLAEHEYWHDICYKSLLPLEALVLILRLYI